MYDPSWLGTITLFVAQKALSVIGVDYASAQLWAPALVQHYGPGSHYLDVTRDIEVALWFSLHKYHELWIGLKEGNDPENLRDIFHTVAWFTDVQTSNDQDEAPVIYAFDAEVWNGNAVPRHGQLVELLALEPGRALAKRAGRLRCQSAALIYSDPNNTDGPQLNGKLVAAITLARPFNLDRTVTARKSVHEIVPPPAEDQLYKALIAYPSYMKFEPPHLEQPLPIPFFLNSVFRVQDSPNVIVLGGSGTYAAPLRLKFRLLPGPDLAAVQELREYMGLTHHITPSPFHASLLAAKLDPIDLAGRIFRFQDALELMLETPLWTFTPSVDNTPRGLRMWIQSALPLGIADEIAGRSTDNVYVEICPLDVISPGKSVGEDLLRAVWVVRSGLEYAITVFRRGNVGTYSYTLQYHHNESTGTFDLLGYADLEESTEKPDAEALKALFVTLTLLRDLSPENKPPPYYYAIADGKDYLPYPLLEGQFARPCLIAGTNLVIPKALDGSSYLRASGAPRETSLLPEDSEEAFTELERFVPMVKSPHYVAWAGSRLAEMYVDRGRFEDALQILAMAGNAAQSEAIGPILERLQLLVEKIVASMH